LYLLRQNWCRVHRGVVSKDEKSLINLKIEEINDAIKQGNTSKILDLLKESSVFCYNVTTNEEINNYESAVYDLVAYLSTNMPTSEYHNYQIEFENIIKSIRSFSNLDNNQMKAEIDNTIFDQKGYGREVYYSRNSYYDLQIKSEIEKYAKENERRNEIIGQLKALNGEMSKISDHINLYSKYTNLTDANKELWDQWTGPISEMANEIEVSWYDDEGMSISPFQNSLDNLTNKVVNKLIMHFLIGTDVDTWKAENIANMDIENIDDYAYPDWMMDINGDPDEDKEESLESLFEAAKNYIEEQLKSSDNDLTMKELLILVVKQIVATQSNYVRNIPPHVTKLVDFCRDYMSGFDQKIIDIFNKYGIAPTPEAELKINDIGDCFNGILDVVISTMGTGVFTSGKITTAIFKYIAKPSKFLLEMFGDVVDGCFVVDDLLIEVSKIFEELCSIPKNIKDDYENAIARKDEIVDLQDQLQVELDAINKDLENDTTEKLIINKKNWDKEYENKYNSFLGINLVKKYAIEFDAKQYYERTKDNYINLWRVLKFKINFYSSATSTNLYANELDIFEQIELSMEGE
jgi:hypothetical protein